MLIKGIQKTSLIDYTPYTAGVLFVGGCNFRCPYCQNRDLVLNYKKMPTIKEEEVLNFLKDKKKWLDGVCITGGEPLLYDITNFIKKIKKIGLLVKVDTNGSNPGLLKRLVDNKLVDYVAMDIKSSLENYDKAAGVSVDISKIRETASVLLRGIVEYEFRMTAVPSLVDKEDFKKIGLWLKGADKFAIQQFRNEIVLEERFKKIKPFSSSKLNEFKEILRPFFKNVEVRGV